MSGLSIFITYHYNFKLSLLSILISKVLSSKVQRNTTISMGPCSIPVFIDFSQRFVLAIVRGLQLIMPLHFIMIMFISALLWHQFTCHVYIFCWFSNYNWLKFQSSQSSSSLFWLKFCEITNRFIQ